MLGCVVKDLDVCNKARCWPGRVTVQLEVKLDVANLPRETYYNSERQ